MIFYIPVVSLVMLLIAWPALRKLKTLKEHRRNTIKKRPEPGAIPARRRMKAVKEQQIQRMETHISITRRTLILLFMFVGIAIAAIPYLSKLAPAVLPIIITAMSVIIGIAAKPIIENITCGLVLCFGKLARIGDTVVIDDVYGVIEDFTLTHSVIKRWDSLRYIVPNSSMMTKEFINYSLHDNDRWVYVEFWIDYNTDIALAERIAKETPIGSLYFSDKEEPRFWVSETERQAVKCMIVAWATSPSDGWMLGHDIRKALVIKLQENNITTHTHRLHMNPSCDPTNQSNATLVREGIQNNDE